MRTLVYALVLSCLGASALHAQHHDPVYLVGGDTPVANPAFRSGVNLLDARGAGLPTLSLLLAPGSYSRFAMDGNNRDVIVGVDPNPNSASITAGLYRFDPTTSATRTIVSFPPQPSVFRGVSHPTIDHNGDYIFVMNRYATFTFDTFIMKADASGAVTTLLASPSLTTLRGPVFSSRLTRDIDTGNILLAVTESGLQVPTTINSPVLSIDTETGTIATWATTTGYAGWKGGFSLPQNHRTGRIEAAYGNYILWQYPGSGGRVITTLLPPPHYINGAGDFDLQTAPTPRLVYYSQTRFATGPQTFLSFVDPLAGTVTSTAAANPRIAGFGFDFYRGRHTQTVAIGARRWLVSLSAPRYPGYQYAVAASLSGVRPGIALADGRRINLVADAVTALTLSNALPTFWNPGPGTLDANGGASATLDLSTVGRLGIPLWIAWAVLDPNAPAGIAYLPDTYVMRV